MPLLSCVILVCGVEEGSSTYTKFGLISCGGGGGGGGDTVTAYVVIFKSFLIYRASFRDL